MAVEMTVLMALTGVAVLCNAGFFIAFAGCRFVQAVATDILLYLLLC